MTQLCDLNAPAAVVDVQRMQRNPERMQARANALGVKFRAHVKTTKCYLASVVARLIGLSPMRARSDR